MTDSPIDLSQQPIHLDDQANAVALENFQFDGASFEGYIAAHCTDKSPGRLVMIESSPISWDTWEIHPAGDELVIVLEGRGEMLQQTDRGEVRIDIYPGATVINPKGVWHTANVEQAIKAIYITPCPGTDHKPRT